MEKAKLYQKLINEAIESIESIVDPIAKVQAISSILPFLDKEAESVDVDPEYTKLKEEVEAKIQEEKAKIEQEEQVENTTTVQQQSTISEAKVESEEEIVVKAEETKEEAEKRRELIIKKYGDLTLQQMIDNGNIKYMEYEVNTVTGYFKELLTNFGLPEDPWVYLSYYMTETIKEVTKKEANALDMKVSTYYESFYPFMVELCTIYSYTNDQVCSTLSAMTNGIYNNIGQINLANASALAQALNDTYNQKN